MEPVRIPVTISSKGIVKEVDFEQKPAGSDASVAGNHRSSDQEHWEEMGYGRTTLVHDQTGATFLEITPIHDGWETVRLEIHFEDGGYDERFFHVLTVPSEKNLRSMRLVYFDKTNSRYVQPRIVAFLRYEGVSDEVLVTTLNAFRVSVEQPSNPVVSHRSGWSYA